MDPESASLQRATPTRARACATSGSGTGRLAVRALTAVSPVSSVFWDLYCAAPDRRETCEHSSEAKAFHDYVSQLTLTSCLYVHSLKDMQTGVGRAESLLVAVYIFTVGSKSVFQHLPPSQLISALAQRLGVKGHGTAWLFIGGAEALVKVTEHEAAGRLHQRISAVTGGSQDAWDQGEERCPPTKSQRSQSAACGAHVHVRRLCF